MEVKALNIILAIKNECELSSLIMLDVDLYYI